MLFNIHQMTNINMSNNAMPWQGHEERKMIQKPISDCM